MYHVYNFMMMILTMTIIILMIEADVNTILDHSAKTGLQLNLGKCEIVTDLSLIHI